MVEGMIVHIFLCTNIVLRLTCEPILKEVEIPQYVDDHFLTHACVSYVNIVFNLENSSLQLMFVLVQIRLAGASLPLF